MHFLSALIKCVSIGFVVGFLASNSLDHLYNNLLPLAGLLVIISTVLVLFDLTMEPASRVPVKTLWTTPVLPVEKR